MNHIDNYSTKSYRNSRKIHLEAAGFTFTQNEDNRWMVELPAKGRYHKPTLSTNYKYLGTAINQAENELRCAKARRDEDWQEAIKLYDEYEPPFEDIW